MEYLGYYYSYKNNIKSHFYEIKIIYKKIKQIINFIKNIYEIMNIIKFNKILQYI